tara:strand:+ start:6454 stop:7809 length:1356 start_codon:yes stop_codon:yes gene_type:complete
MLYFWLFFEGFIGLTYQILMFRQLTPVVGRSDYVTAWVIGFFLGAMSVGYKMGGKPTKFPLKKVAVNLILASVIACFMMSSISVDLFFKHLSSMGVAREISLIFYCLIVVAPIAYLIGQSLPLLLQQTSWGKEASEKGGNALFLSTLGSMAGAIIPATFLYTSIGASLTLTVTATLVLISTTLVLFKTNKSILTLCLLGVAYSIYPYVLHEKGGFTSTAYSDIYLIEQKDEKLMYANGLIMSSQDHNGQNTAEYINHFQRKLKQENIQDTDILVLGAGGFMAHTNNKLNNHFTYIDIDKDLVEWASNYFNFDPKTAKVKHGDARAFLLSEEDNRWPLVLMDTFGSRFAMPEHLMTVEFFELISNKITPDGVLAINVIADPQYDTEYAVRLHATITKVFPVCHITPVTHHPTVANISYWCFNRFASKNEFKTYRDDKNSISSDVWTASQRLD